jgi:lactate dehydrogenase-like 2-hydroxyacid dehydrogenase
LAGYLTAERIAKAKKLKLAITAGIGSDHVDLQTAIKHGVTVAEVTYSNSISVSEHVVMMILSLIRNYIPSYQGYRPKITIARDVFDRENRHCHSSITHMSITSICRAK